MPLTEQLLLTLMKLKLNLKDLDLAHRFCISPTTVANIFKTLTHALHELFIDGIMNHYLPSVAKCQMSMPKSFEQFLYLKENKVHSHFYASISKA